MEINSSIMRILLVLGLLLRASWAAPADPIDQAALVAIFNGFTPETSATLNWDTTQDLCDSNYNAGNVECISGKVVHLSFEGKGLKGTLATEIGALTSLIILWVTSNTLSGQIPTEIGELWNLNRLHLNFNEFTGTLPTELGLLNELTQLTAGYNEIGGPIPTELSSLYKLRGLNLRDNQLSGPLPGTLNLDSLESLDLGTNKLTDSLPDTFHLLSSLTYLDLADNQFAGALPHSLFSLSKLVFFNANNNGLTGSLPTEVGNLALLESLQLQNNYISGQLPNTLENLTKLGHVRLANNLLMGSIPPFPPSVYFLSMEKNALTGTLPSFAGFSVLTYLSLHTNLLQGSIPSSLDAVPSLHYLFLRANQLCYNIDYTDWAVETDSNDNAPCAHCGPYCQNGGTCVKGPNCTCPTDYTGTLCEVDLNPCRNDPCNNDGECVNNPAAEFGYSCVCVFPFGGQTCDFDVNICRFNPCQNLGVCVNGQSTFTCHCEGTGYQGLFCQEPESVSVPCPPGFYEQTASGCTPCAAGTFRRETDPHCIFCPKGTYSTTPGAYSPQFCNLCPAGNYSDSVGSTSCPSCTTGCFQAGSFSSDLSPEALTQRDFNLTTYDEDGNPVVLLQEGSVIGYYYLGIFGGFVLLSSAIGFPFHKKFRRALAPLAAVLKTPFTILYVIPGSGGLTEASSFFRGLVGTWVVVGVALVTGYQVHLFVTTRLAEQSALQPGTAYSNGTSTSETPATFTMAVTLYDTPINCNNFEFTRSAVITGIVASSAGELTCKEDSLQSIVLTYTQESSINLTPNSEISLEVASVQDVPLFTHGVSYILTMSSYQQRTVVMTETLVVEDTKVAGDALVTLSAIPTEYLEQTTTLSQGYSYSWFSSQLESLDVATSKTLKFVVKISVQSYYFQVKQVEVISGLQFAVGLLALASGVITAGSLGANFVTYVMRKWKEHKKGKGESEEKGDGPFDIELKSDETV